MSGQSILASLNGFHLDQIVLLWSWLACQTPCLLTHHWDLLLGNTQPSLSASLLILSYYMPCGLKNNHSQKFISQSFEIEESNKCPSEFEKESQASTLMGISANQNTARTVLFNILPSIYGLGDIIWWQNLLTALVTLVLWSQRLAIFKTFRNVSLMYISI